MRLMFHAVFACCLALTATAATAQSDPANFAQVINLPGDAASIGGELQPDTQYNVFPGGTILADAFAGVSPPQATSDFAENIEINLLGGTIEAGFVLTADANSSINANSGQILGRLELFGGSLTVREGAAVGDVFVSGPLPRTVIRGGTVASYESTLGNSMLEMTGGTVSGQIILNRGARGSFSGGIVGGAISARGIFTTSNPSRLTTRDGVLIRGFVSIGDQAEFDFFGGEFENEVSMVETGRMFIFGGLPTLQIRYEQPNAVRLEAAEMQVNGSVIMAAAGSVQSVTLADGDEVQAVLRDGTVFVYTAQASPKSAQRISAGDISFRRIPSNQSGPTEYPPNTTVQVRPDQDFNFGLIANEGCEFIIPPDYFGFSFETNDQLITRGTAASPVVLRPTDLAGWDGIRLLPGASANLAHTRVINAETNYIFLNDAKLTATDSFFGDDPTLIIPDSTDRAFIRATNGSDVTIERSTFDTLSAADGIDGVPGNSPTSTGDSGGPGTSGSPGSGVYGILFDGSSNLTVRDSVFSGLHAGHGGNGGRGGNGFGGFTGADVLAGQEGAQGGPGGAGGNGGDAGSGGDAYPIMVLGDAIIDITQNVFTDIRPGDGGDGGRGGNGGRGGMGGQGGTGLIGVPGGRGGTGGSGGPAGDGGDAGDSGGSAAFFASNLAESPTALFRQNTTNLDASQTHGMFGLPGSPGAGGPGGEGGPLIPPFILPGAPGATGSSGADGSAGGFGTRNDMYLFDVFSVATGPGAFVDPVARVENNLGYFAPTSASAASFGRFTVNLPGEQIVLGRNMLNIEPSFAVSPTAIVLGPSETLQGNVLLPSASVGDFEQAPGSDGVDRGLTDSVAPGSLTDLAGNPRFADEPSNPSIGSPIAPGGPVDLGAVETPGLSCPANFDQINGTAVTSDDVIAYLSSLDVGAWYAEFSGDGPVDVFDLTAYLRLFDAGCP